MARGGHRLADLLTTLCASFPIQLGSIVLTNGTFGFSWNTISGRASRVQWQQPGDSTWHDLTAITASSASASFVKPLGPTPRLYRVAQ